MARIPNAEPSPRIVNGELHWYQGDTFSIELHLDLKDQDDTPITIAATDTVKVVFTDRSGAEIKVFDPFTNIVDNKITLTFDSAKSAKFVKGQYRYDIIYTGQNRTTIADENKVVVE